jgi:hypothetical protein
VTIPVAAPAVAFATVLLVQMPPDAVSVNVIAAPTHTPADPEIAEGIAYTVTVLATVQPDKVYAMLTDPAPTPFTTPAVLTVAILTSLLLHVPPPASASVVVSPTHAVAVPVIAAGCAFTETNFVTLQPEDKV